MSNLDIFFRRLIIFSVATSLTSLLLDMLVPNSLPITLQHAYDMHADEHFGSMNTAFLLAGFAYICIVFLVAIAATIGLYFFKAWARTASLWTTIIAAPMFPLVGVLVESGWAAMFTYASTIAWGAVLAVAYFSDVSRHFEQPIAN